MKIQSLFLLIGLFSFSALLPANIIEVTDANFDSVVLRAPKPVIVDFWMEGCPPCKVMKPIFQKLAAQYSNRYEFVTINISDAPEAVLKCGIAKVPTFVVVHNGVIKGIYPTGIRPENFLSEVETALNSK